MSAVPNTVARLSHALTIRARGRTVGAIHQWAPSTSRTVEAEFEVNLYGHGLPRDLVPQNVEQRTIRVSRYDTYPEIMEQVFGSSELITLMDQFRPFSVREVWRGPAVNFLGGAGTALAGLGALTGSKGIEDAGNTISGAQGAGAAAIAAAASSNPIARAVVSTLGAFTADTRIYEYTGCCFTDLGRTMDAKSDRVVSVEATLVWLSRRRVA